MRGNLGVEGREAFKRTFIDEFMPYHMYVCPKDGKGHIEHIAFREYLRNHPDDMNAYGKLKIELAEEFKEEFKMDINSYVNGKAEFIKNSLQKAKSV